MPQPNLELHTPKLNKREHTALKQLAKGEAEPHQQILAVEVIVKKLSRAFELAYLPGDTHASAFLSGRGFVGQQITKYINQPTKED